jgi:hypothetical protein
MLLAIKNVCFRRSSMPILNNHLFNEVLNLFNRGAAVFAESAVEFSRNLSADILGLFLIGSSYRFGRFPYRGCYSLLIEGF